MKGQKVLMSSSRKDWRTPAPLFALLDAEFRFTVDLAAAPHNALLPRYYTEQNSGLAADWAGESGYCNPPYGHSLVKPWVAKAHYHAERSEAITVLLVASRTDAVWMHAYAKYAQVRLIKGRLHFDGAPHGATFPSAILIFKPGLPRPSVEFWDWQAAYTERFGHRPPAPPRPPKKPKAPKPPALLVDILAASSAEQAIEIPRL